MAIQKLFSRKHFQNKSPYDAINIFLGKNDQNHFLRNATLFPRPNHKLEVSTVPDMQYNLCFASCVTTITATKLKWLIQLKVSDGTWLLLCLGFMETFDR